MRLNPKDPPIYLNNLGYTYFLLRRYDEAIGALKKSLSLNPCLTDKSLKGEFSLPGTLCHHLICIGSREVADGKFPAAV